MDERVTDEAEAAAVEQIARDALSQGDADFAGAVPVLRYLLSGGRSGLFSDDVLAATRGMLSSIAAQMLHALASAAEARDHDEFVAIREQEFLDALCTDRGLLAHAHSLALETRLGNRLEGSAGLDQVLTPLLQDLVASKTGGTSALAMALIAAQARFVQQQKRMELPLGELPGELFHRVTQILLTLGDDHPRAAKAARKRLREAYDEARSRLGLLTRLLTGLEEGIAPSLELAHAGVALFATGLALGTNQERDLVLLMLGERQPVRLVLALQAAGTGGRLALAQLALVRPEADLPAALFSLSAAHAGALLVRAQQEGEG